jgi:hypothetical protein
VSHWLLAGTGVWNQDFTLTRHSTTWATLLDLFLCWIFSRYRLLNYFPRVALYCNPPELYLLSI